MFKLSKRTVGLVIIALMTTMGFVSLPRPTQADPPITLPQQDGPGGEMIVRQGYTEPQRATAQLLSEPPELTAEQLQCMEKALANSHRPDLPLQVDPATAGLVPQPDVPETPLGSAIGRSDEGNIGPQAPAPEDYAFFRNVDVRDTANLTGFVSSTNEPSADSRDDAIFMTGNWYAAFSTDRGQFFQFVNPFTTFPASDGGFCCDQVVIYDESRDLLFWLLQYINDGTDNRQRLAVIHGSDLRAGMTGADWYYYDFNAASFGITGNRELDYPKMALSNNYLYINTNVYVTNGGWTNAVAWWIDLDDLDDEGGIGFSYFTRTDTASFMPTDGATTTMYWGTHTSLSQVRIYRWPEGSGSYFWDDVNVASWTDGTHNCPAPDGNDPCEFGDDRPLAGWVAGGVIGFMWNADEDGSHPYPYVYVARFNESDRSLINLPHIWNPSYAWLYPAVSVNNRGHIAGPVFVSGGGYYPTVYIIVADDISGDPAPWENHFVRASTDGPVRNRWGDYVASRRHEQYPNTWTSTGFTLQGGSGNADTHPQWVWHGRERDQPPNTPNNDDFDSATTITASALADPMPDSTFGETSAAPSAAAVSPGFVNAVLDPEKAGANPDALNAPDTATDITPMATLTQDTTEATTAVDDPITSCGSTANPRQSRSVWYKFTPSSTSSYAISTEGSDYDTVLAVWTGSRGSLTEQGCDDDGGSGLQSFLTLTLNSGTTYYIEAMRYSSGSGGQLTLNVGSASPVDVYLLIDLSGSFYDDLPVFKAQAPGIVSTLRASYPNIRFGLGKFEDYPINPFGSAADGDKAYERLVDLTSDTNLVLNTIDGLFVRYGMDTPESQLVALYQAATGAGQDLSGVGYPGASIPPGQQASFRDGATKLFLLWTDAPFHLPGDPGDIPYPGPSFNETVDAILALDPPKVIGVFSSGLTSSSANQGVQELSLGTGEVSALDGLSDLKAIARATGALAPADGVDCDGDETIDLAPGQPLVCGVSSSGEGIGEAIVALVEAGTKPAVFTIHLPTILKNF